MENNNADTNVENTATTDVNVARGAQTIAEALPPTVEDKTEAAWMYDENTPGTGDKPEWFNEKTFKSVAEQAKAAIELRKALGERTGSPEEYKFDISDLGDEYKDFKVDENDQLFAFWKDFSKEAKLPQEMFSKGIKAWADYISHLQEDRTESFKKSVESLGVGFDNTVTELENWYKNNFPDQSFDSFKNLMQTPDDIKMAIAMKDKMQSTSIKVNDTAPTVSMDRDYWRHQMSKENGYGINMPKTKQVTAEFQKFVDGGGKL